MAIPFKEATFPLDGRSMAGFAALHGKTENIEDAYRLPASSPYEVSRSFDQESGYRTKSVLVVPMRDHKGEVIGVVQLINKKMDESTILQPVSEVETKVIPFTSVDEQLVGSLASQAAVAFQNAALLKNIRDLFEEFVNAAVNAVEKRDPVTSGHSERVAILTVGLAERVDGLSTGPLAGVSFTRDQMEELRYASILHDFGKVAVPEKVLKKGKKLLGSELKAIELRFAYRARTLEAAHLRRRMEALDAKRRDPDALVALDAEFRQSKGQLHRALEAIRLANEPRLVEERGIGVLEACFATVRALPVREFETRAAEQELPVEAWAEGPLLSTGERDALLIPRGSLTDEERNDPLQGINSHVQHTYEFLQRIPWTGELRRIPEIAWAHHEKLDGSGYPRQLAGPAAIPVQSRMMTISDIFDALRAWDRPYKRAVSPERALDILTDDMEREARPGPAHRLRRVAHLGQLRLPPPAEGPLPPGADAPKVTAATPLVIAHRGDSAHRPENTLASFASALEVGAGIVELDVQLTGDAQVVVIHDPEVDRTTSGRGDVRRMDLAAIRALSAGYPERFGDEWRRERVPSLAEALALLHGRARVMIEIKKDSVSDDAEGGIEARTIAEVRRQGLADQVALISFEHRALLRCRDQAPEIVRGHLFGRATPEEVMRATLDAGCGIVMPHKGQLSEAIAGPVHEAGLKLATWVVDEPEELRRVARFGLYGVGSNRPGVLLQALADGLLD